MNWKLRSKTSNYKTSSAKLCEPHESNHNHTGKKKLNLRNKTRTTKIVNCGVNTNLILRSKTSTYIIPHAKHHEPYESNPNYNGKKIKPNKHNMNHKHWKHKQKLQNGDTNLFEMKVNQPSCGDFVMVIFLR